MDGSILHGAVSSEEAMEVLGSTGDRGVVIMEFLSIRTAHSSSGIVGKPIHCS